MTNPHFIFRVPNAKGFTLVEIIIVIVIVAIVASIAAMIILQGMRAYSDVDLRSNLLYQGKLGMERMSREIRLIRSRTAADITTMTAATLRYTDIKGRLMGFRLNAGNIERTEDNGATWQPLTAGVTALTFSYLQQDGTPAVTAATVWYVVVDLTVQQGSDSMQVRTRVHPMNF